MAMNSKYTSLVMAVMLFCGSIALSGCSRDGSEYIVGDWQRTAMDWTYSGSPNASTNYSNGGPMSELAGASDLRFVFFENNQGMMIDRWFVSPDENGTDTTHFTYTINGDGGILSPTTTSEGSTWTTTYTLQNIKRGKMTVYEKTIAENQQDPFGDTSPYTRVIEIWHHCEK